MGFEELPHKADCALRVWADDLPTLFAEAGLGLNLISGARIGDGLRTTRDIRIHAADAEELIVDFLTELTFFQERDHLGFDSFDLQVSEHDLSGLLKGAVLASVSRPIKAVTFHGLKMRRTSRGHEVDIVFDV